jgi:endo-1,4-beta-xylanase
MVNFSKLTFGLTAIATALASRVGLGTNVIEKRGPFNFSLDPDHPLFRRNLTSRSNTNFNQDYTTGGTVNYSPGTNGYSVSWNTQQDFVVGVGWQPGSTA